MIPRLKLFGSEYNWYNILLLVTIITTVLFIQNYKLKSKYSNYSIFERNISMVFFILIAYFGSISFGIFEKFLIKLNHNSDFVFTLKVFITEFITSSTGRWFGSVLLLTIAVFIYTIVVKKYRYLKMIDLMAITVCLGLILGKIGCFLDGHYGCYGIQTDLPWGVHFIYGKGKSLVPVHPTQIYDAIFHCILLVILLKLNKKESIKPGFIFVLFLSFTSFYNLLIECIRTNKRIFGQLTFAQVTYLLVIILTALMFLKISLFYKKDLNKKVAS